MKAATIRAARAADAPAILALEQHFPTDRMSLRSVRRFLASKAARAWVARAAGDVVGALVLITRRGSRVARIYSIVVAPAARGQGLGARLVQAAERATRKLGCDAVSLEVREDNRTARAMYARLGYAVAARLPGYYADGAPGLRLRKTLAGCARRG